MAIKMKCPHCEAAYTLADTMKGKKVRCKACQQIFPVTDLTKKAAVPVEDSEELIEAVFAPTPSEPEPAEDDDVPAKKPRRREPDDEEDEERPRKKDARAKDADEDQPRSRRGRADDDDDEEDQDDDTPRSRRKKGAAGSSAKMWIIIGTAAAVALLGGVGLFFALQTREDPNVAKVRKAISDPDKFTQEIQKKLDEMVKAPNDSNPFLEKKELTLAEYLQNLRTGDDRAKTDAVNYFSRTDPNVPERPEVAKALEPLVEGRSTLGAVNRAFTTWATKEQAPLLVKMVRKDKGPSHNGQAMLALGKLKEPSGVEPIAEHMGDIFARDSATKALKEYGSDAEPGLVRTMFHKDNNTRVEVQKLITGLNVPAEKVYPQAVKDLSNPEKESRNAAANWLAKNAVSEAFRADVSKGLDSMLNNMDTRGAALKALETWATKDNVPTLAMLLGQDNVPRGDIIRVLGKLKDDRAAEALAARFPTGDRQPAATALREIGPGAQKAVLAYLNHSDGGASGEARKLLKEWNVPNETLIDQTVKDLASAKEANQRRPALSFLIQAQVEDMLRGKVGKAIEPLLADQGVQGDAYKAFFHWAGRENLPILVKLISNPGPYRSQAMDAGAKLKDENAAMAIASNLVVPGGDRGHAVKSLKTMGPIAEQAVQKVLMATKDAGVRIEACHILREIGTRASLPILNFAVKTDPKNKNLFKAASEAAAGIQSR